MAVTEKPTPAPPNPIELARLYGDIARKSGEMMTRFMQRPRNGTRSGADETGVGQAFFSAWMKLLTNPVKLAEMQMKLWQENGGDTKKIVEHLMRETMEGIPELPLDGPISKSPPPRNNARRPRASRERQRPGGLRTEIPRSRRAPRV